MVTVEFLMILTSVRKMMMNDEDNDDVTSSFFQPTSL